MLPDSNECESERKADDYNPAASILVALVMSHRKFQVIMNAVTSETGTETETIQLM